MNTNTIYGIIVVILIMLSAFFSCVETAFSCANTIRLQALLDLGSKKAKNALWVTDRFDKALTAILIGNNVVNLGCSSLATVICLDIFENYGAAIATGIVTLLVLTFGEVIPKCFGREASDSIVLHTAFILKIFTCALYPLVYFFLGIKTVVMKLANIKKDAPTVTEDELKYIIESSEKEGILETEESKMVQSALEFDEKTALEILTPRVDVVALDIDDEKERILSVIMDERYSRIPVYKESIDNIVGILHTRDYLEKIVNNDTADLNSLITPPHFIYKSANLSSILNDFRENKLHIAIVTDEYGGMLGIVTMEDLLEEIVGEIWDEDEEEITTYTKLKDGRYIVSGDMDTEDLFEIFDIKNDDNIKSISVGGFIAERLGDIPKRNCKVEYKNLLFTVRRIKNNRIITALVQKKN